ncbi:MAG: hypothetical protein OHK0024_33510 [Thalassobaculales bacterium]
MDNETTPPPRPISLRNPLEVMARLFERSAESEPSGLNRAADLQVAAKARELAAKEPAPE